MKYHRHTEEFTKKGKVKYGHYFQEFKDEDTGELFTIELCEAVEFNGVPIRFYSNSEVLNMTESDRNKLLI